jgi:predicted nucleotidyltransferase
MASRIELDAETIREFCVRWKVTELSLFGSVLREDFGPQSDVDVLVSFSPDACGSLFDLVDMEEELESLFGRKVDLVEAVGLRNPFRRKAILESRRVIHAA